MAFFVVGFLLLSTLIGKRIIGTDLLYGAGFWIYGGAGKGLLFALVVFAILAYKQKTRIPQLLPFNPKQLWGPIGCAVSLVGLWGGLQRLEADLHNLGLTLLCHGLLMASICFLAVWSFDLASLRTLYQAYRRELGISAIVAMGFYGLFNLIYRMWAVLANVVLHAVSWLLMTVGLNVYIEPPRTLLLDKFGVTIEQYCSGIESLALFVGLFTLIAVLDWERFNKKRLTIAFVGGLAGLFAFNILRVFLLILGGFYINPVIAFTLFHSYAGMVLFIIYFWLFWSLCYKWIQKKSTNSITE